MDESNLEQKLKQAGLWLTGAALPTALAITVKATTGFLFSAFCFLLFRSSFVDDFYA